MIFRTVVLLVALVATLSNPLASAQSVKMPRPNIVFFFIDDMG